MFGSVQRFIRQLNGKTCFLVLLAITLFITAYYPALQMIVNQWINSDEYSHAFLVLPVIGYMIWTRKHQLNPEQANLSSAGIVILAAAFPIYLFALLTQVQTIIYGSFYLTIIGGVIFLFGGRGLVIIALPLLLFAMLIPIPDQLYIKLTFPLQLKVSEASEYIIRSVGIPILREGNIMNIPEKRFEVVEACSGLRSMITLLTLSVIIGYFTLKKISSKFILIASSIPIAVIINILRVICMVLAFHFFKMDLAEGTLHTIFGVFIFGIALIALFSLRRVLE